MLHVEHRYPSAFYAPGRWGTADGYIPFRICWAYFSFLSALQAIESLGTARGIGLAFAGSETPGDPHADAVADAFPRER